MYMSGDFKIFLNLILFLIIKFIEAYSKKFKYLKGEQIKNSLPTPKTHFQIGHPFLPSCVQVNITKQKTTSLHQNIYFSGITDKHFFKCSFSPTQMES